MSFWKQFWLFIWTNIDFFPPSLTWEKKCFVDMSYLPETFEIHIKHLVSCEKTDITCLSHKQKNNPKKSWSSRTLEGGFHRFILENNDVFGFDDKVWHIKRSALCNSRISVDSFPCWHCQILLIMEASWDGRIIMYWRILIRHERDLFALIIFVDNVR